MKALEILDYFMSEQIANRCTPFLLEMYNEAIAELESLQQRSCDGCKYGEIDKFEQYRVTCRNKLALFNQMINADFCCNRYEAKGAMR